MQLADRHDISRDFVGFFCIYTNIPPLTYCNTFNICHVLYLYILYKRLRQQKIMDSKNFDLSEEEFENLRAGLKKGDDSLFERIFLSHFSDCLGYLQSKFNINHEEAYDASMDTMLEFRRYLIEDKIKYGNLRYLFTRMAAQRWMKLNKKEAMVDTTDEIPEMLDLNQVHSDEELEILDKSWAKISQDCQKLLKQFYYDKIKLSAIAENLGKNPSSLRKQKERCLTNLRTNFQQLI